MKIVKIAKKAIMNCVKFTYKVLYRFIPTDDKTILFISFHGRGYSDNPKAIHEYMIQQEEYADYKYVWALKKPDEVDIPNAHKIRYARVKYFWYLARAKYWVCNCKIPMYVRKKENQVYLQTWHGTPLKRLAHDIQLSEDSTFYRSEMSAAEMRETYDDDVKKYTYMVSPNKFCTKVFQSAFKINRERLIETGYPRNDFISNVTEEQIRDLKMKYGLPMDKKIVLYAPTWRDDNYNAKGYLFELEADFKKWKEKLGKDYVVIFKPHYLIINKYQNDNMDGFLFNIDASADISELYAVSDILVTDYSSVFFDYAILKRPIYFYMYDVEKYKDMLRGFYLDIYEDLPGPVIKNEDELLEWIVEGRTGGKDIDEFAKIFTHCEDGHCSQRVVDIMIKGGNGQ